MKPQEQPGEWNLDDASQPATADPIPSPQVVTQPEGIEWEASEYLQHHNGVWWYVGFFTVAAVLIGFSILFQAWTFIPLVVLMSIAGVIHVRRPPRIIHYVLNDEGLQMGEKMHSYAEFKSFSVIRDGAFFAIMLIPVRRFLPSTIVYFDEADGEDIVDAFGDRLPMENHDLDAIDKFLRFIRF